MLYTDRIYGKVKITESVVLDLIKSRTMQRLKGIDQGGYYEVHFPGTKHSRFEHSLGVYILLKKFGASIPEQIAGLLHDVSHAAFSHCADHYFREGSPKKQNHQDNTFVKYILKSEIPGILKRHKFDVDCILNDNNFPLKENNLPDLCADRIDYSLRGIVIFKLGNKKDVKNVLLNLKANKGRWIFDNFKYAQKFAYYFQKLNNIYYAGLKTALMFLTVGDYIKYALDKKFIRAEDLYTTDNEVLKKIRQFHGSDAKLKYLFDRMNNRVKFKNNPKNFDARVFCKSRIVDPLCHHEGKIKRLSEIKPGWKDAIKKEMKPKEYFIKFFG